MLASNLHYLALLGLNVCAITLNTFLVGECFLGWVLLGSRFCLSLSGQIECGCVPGSCPACAGWLSQEESGTLYSLCSVAAVADSGCSI